MNKLIRIIFLAICLHICLFNTSAMAQSQNKTNDNLYLNTIGAFSAGFVLQSYGYIGALADMLSQGAYQPSLVQKMLSETITYLNNVNKQLDKYQYSDIASGDRKFVSNVMEIINLLVEEAEALSSFAETRNQDDLARFEKARKNAWSNIKKTFAMN